MQKIILEKQALNHLTQPTAPLSVQLRPSERAVLHPQNLLAPQHVLTSQVGKRPFVVQQQVSRQQASGLPLLLDSSRAFVASRARGRVSTAILPWFYRCWLLGATLVLSLVLLRLQAILDRVPTHHSIWQTSVQWAELSWLAPVPLAVILWLGWFIFAEVARPRPTPMEVPTVTARKGLFAYVPPKPVRLVFRFVTRGDNVDVLGDSVIAVHRAFERYSSTSGPYRIEIVSDRPLSLPMREDPRTFLYVVPAHYVTEQRSRFKAKALTYLQEQVHPEFEDWYIYLDEESLVDEEMLAGLYRFIWRP